MLEKIKEKLLGAIFDAACGAIYGGIIAWWLMRHNGGMLDWAPIKICASAFAAFGLIFGNVAGDLIACMGWVLGGFSQGESRSLQHNSHLEPAEQSPNLIRLLFVLALMAGLWFRHAHGIHTHTF